MVDCVLVELKKKEGKGGGGGGGGVQSLCDKLEMYTP